MSKPLPIDTKGRTIVTWYTNSAGQSRFKVKNSLGERTFPKDWSSADPHLTALLAAHGRSTRVLDSIGNRHGIAVVFYVQAV